MAKNNKLKNNYINLYLILMGVILMTIGSSNLYKNYSENKINQSYISKYVANIQPNEIENASLEFSPDTYIYVSHTGDKNIYNLEVKLKKFIKDNDLIDNFIYMDVTELMKKDKYIDEINSILGIENNKLKKLPGIIYFKDNNVVDFIDSQSNLINTGDFLQLLEKYEIVN